MLAKVTSYGLSGLDAYPITIEVDVSNGLPSTIIVGLPDSAVKESRERVRSAIKNSGYKFPAQRITVNLSPADIKKEGPSFDLAIAVSILAASGQIDSGKVNEFAFLGELSLDGRLQPIVGSLSLAMAIPKNKYKGLLVPKHNANESNRANSVPIYPAETLTEAIHIVTCPESAEPYRLRTNSRQHSDDQYDFDFADVKGQQHVKRGLEIAAAGGHNALSLCTQYYPKLPPLYSSLLAQYI